MSAELDPSKPTDGYPAGGSGRAAGHGNPTEAAVEPCSCGRVDRQRFANAVKTNPSAQGPNRQLTITQSRVHAAHGRQTLSDSSAGRLIPDEEF